MAVTADVDVEARPVAARRPVLDQLVREAVDAALVVLFDRELDAALERLASRNGTAAELVSPIGEEDR